MIDDVDEKDESFASSSERAVVFFASQFWNCDSISIEEIDGFFWCTMNNARMFTRMRKITRR